MEAIQNFLQSTGFALIGENPLNLVMIVVACALLYLAIVKKFEPLLLLPIAFGMLLTNLPGAGMYHAEYFADGVINWAELGTGHGGLIDYLYLGVKLGIYPCLIFIGVGAMTDFGPLIANPKSLLRHHRRRGRPHRYLHYGYAGPPSPWAHRGGSLLLHGAGAGYPAPHYEGADHQRRAQDQDEPAAPGF